MQIIKKYHTHTAYEKHKHMHKNLQKEFENIRKQEKFL